MSSLGLGVPDRPIIPYIEGDGVGSDISPATRAVLDAAVKACYGSSRELVWYEVFAGEKSVALSGEPLPTATLDALRTHLVGLRGPLAPPGRGGLVSLSIALRQVLDLYVSHRPVRHLPGIPSILAPRSSPITLFRENTEDIYGAIEFAAGAPATCAMMGILRDVFPVHYDRVRFSDECALAIKTASREGTRRLMAAAVWHALETNAPSLTLVSKASALPLVDGAFVRWAYDAATTEFRVDVVTEREVRILSAAASVRGDALAKGTAAWAPVADVADLHLHGDGAAGRIAAAAFADYRGLSRARQAALRKEVDLTLQTIGATHGDGLWRRKLLIRDRECDEAVQDLVLRPETYAVIVTQSLYGDMVSDLLAAQVGGAAVIPSASVNAETGVALFEAAHGPAADQAGLDTYNPCSLIMSGPLSLVPPICPHALCTYPPHPRRDAAAVCRLGRGRGLRAPRCGARARRRHRDARHHGLAARPGQGACHTRQLQRLRAARRRGDWAGYPPHLAASWPGSATCEACASPRHLPHGKFHTRLLDKPES